MADDASFDCKFCRYLRAIEDCSNGNYLDIIVQNSYKDEKDGGGKILEYMSEAGSWLD